MKTFKQYLDEKVKQPTGDLKTACWKGYTAVGTKEKNGRTVPNCVPVKEDGMGAGVAVPGPTNVVGTGAIAGSGGKGGEPGVYLPRRKNSPVMLNTFRRKAPK